jgi:DNA uptake protein ComE-like DNA-binding protein
MKLWAALLLSLALITPALAGEKIDINKAPITVLDKLEVKNTGPLLSERIQGGRPYKTIGDLTAKKVISPKEFEAIKNLIMVKEK